MEKSGFFADIEGDRGYTDDFLAEWVASFIENGVYNTELGQRTLPSIDRSNSLS